MRTVKTMLPVFLALAGVAVLAVSCTETKSAGPAYDVEIKSTFDNADGNSSDGLFSTYSGATQSVWTYATDETYPDTLAFTSSRGGKVLFTGSEISVGTVEVDITLTEGIENGNAGLVVYSSKYSNNGPDSLHGIYIGLGRNNGSGPSSIEGTEVAPKAAFIQIGQMQDNWKQLGLARLNDGAPVEYPLTCHLVINMTDEGIQILANGEQKGKFMPDPAFSAGGAIGFRTYNAAGYIDNLSITGASLSAAAE